MSSIQSRERSYEGEVKTDSDRSRLANGRAESVLGPARLFAESVMVPARPFAELDWSSSANGRAESAVDPARQTAELNPSWVQPGRSPNWTARPFAELDWSSSVNGRAESVFDDQICLVHLLFLTIRARPWSDHQLDHLRIDHQLARPIIDHLWIDHQQGFLCPDQQLAHPYCPGHQLDVNQLDCSCP
ncbi:hypothetical protein F2Q69_00005629 [Brassica cretica]|uniref:Uncharacterized protein n=1 Tax=Brassica cretica TaxID=69181 RepID=A0A8S9PR66_BRACR|nr:hypothetical protein F2Q69_00005629 [Brassica cretica]